MFDRGDEACQVELEMTPCSRGNWLGALEELAMRCVCKMDNKHHSIQFNRSFRMWD